ncbi:hypothetical protein ALO95_200122 [Pseudomonas syringae pv. antirrhini]|uniref:NTF2 fold immunity protein domain-containing protein n=1 Tax=Pseudomonas syringae pv. antirrhini TaxID=251702 RepID=A0A0P9LUV2_9PSED|nr:MULTISPECIES: NTF2 fold immunity protein [Pseudomonas]KPW48242.1 hypothetical protein ALO88_200121 [Pseudomonas syringae pv. antirrhini]QQN27554.1 hypothetical protein JHZ65_00615 [Pseudomonas syringae pv. maculicola]RMO79213.1 hypothetical protein ALQ34_02117 [Pseudomonas syringae pv. maculicola]RMP35691.1 hypothetical protein ALQ24_01442 [Pseudomonas syringae pv. antirrhini]RMP41960.1 hypothetical protein ALQ23_200305 [Pseudomonas syringae pv. antirrhini]
MAQILKPKIETIISEEVVERSFRDFSTAMCNWELWLYEHKRAMRDVENDSSDADERAYAELLAIFSAHVTRKDRNYDRLENLVCSVHPDYEFEHNSVKLEISSQKKATVIYKKKHGLAQTYRLTFSIVDNACKIQKCEFQDDDKWRTTYI